MLRSRAQLVQPLDTTKELVVVGSSRASRERGKGGQEREREAIKREHY